MPDVDELKTALREEADRLPAVPLLPDVRSRARRLQRIRLAGVGAAVAVAIGTVAGVGYLALSRSSSTFGEARPVTDVGALVGPTWYLTSWTTADGTVVLPTTDRPPTLVFDSHTAAHSDDPTNTTTWIVRLRKGTLFGIEGRTTLVGEGPAAQAANAAVRGVLSGSAAWQINGSTLTIRKGPGPSLRYSTSPPTASPSVGASLAASATTAIATKGDTASLLGRKWYLTSVTRNGRSWAPGVESSLVFTDASTADTNDGVNDKQWQVTMGPDTVTWVPGEETAVGETSLAFQLGNAISGVLKGTTAWSVHAGTLVLSGSDGSSLSYATTEPAAPKPYSGALVFLDNNPPGGVVARGQLLNLIEGQVTITDTHGAVKWSGLVTGDDGGNGVLPPGPYTITAVVQGGSCTPLPVTVVADQVGEFTLVCATSQPTASQHG